MNEAIEVFSEDWGWVPGEVRGEPDGHGAFYVIIYPPDGTPRHTWRGLTEEGRGWRKIEAKR